MPAAARSSDSTLGVLPKLAKTLSTTMLFSPAVTSMRPSSARLNSAAAPSQIGKPLPMIVTACSLTSGSVKPPMLFAMSIPVTSTPIRLMDWPISRPITPRPMTTAELGSVSSSKNSSVVIMSSRNSFHASGMIGREPVAITMRSARMRWPLVVSSRLGSINLAYSSMSSPSGKLSELFESTRSTKLSRKSRTYSIASSVSRDNDSPPSRPKRE